MATGRPKDSLPSLSQHWRGGAQNPQQQESSNSDRHPQYGRFLENHRRRIHQTQNITFDRQVFLNFP